MAAQERILDGISDEDTPASRMAKTSNDDWRDLFELKVKIPSAAKAYENDWRSLNSAQRKLRPIFNGYPRSPLTDQERTEFLGDPHSPDFPSAAGLEQMATPRNNGLPRRSENEAIKEDSAESSDDDGDVDVYKEFEWLEPINGFVLSKKTITNGKPDCVGSCSSVLIRRNKIQCNFHDDIEEPTEETSAMGLSLFDRYGRLKPTFKKDSSRSGSGIWGDELDSGDILLVDQVRIDKCHRRQGLSKEIVRVILQKALAKCNPKTFVAIARSAVVNSEVESECQGKSSEERSAIYNRETRVAECFLRSLGFRRIGFTRWFAFLPGNTQHACHSLAADEDFDPPGLTPVQTTNAIFETLLEAFQTIKDDTARLEIIHKALESYGPEEDIWVSADRDGNTLLHHVAISENPTCVKWIVGKCPRLVTIRNHLGETPLESCQEHLEDVRTHTQGSLIGKIKAISDEFTGNSQPFLDILCTLKELRDPSPEELQRLKYGCTCGQCQEGFISPRMHFSLLCCAEATSDMLLNIIDRIDGDFFVECNHDKLQYLQPRVRDNLRTNKTMRQGFVSTFGHFARCLRDCTEPPRVHKILEMARSAREWPPVNKNYLDRGGTVEAVGSALFMITMDESLWAGDGVTWDTWAHDMEALPACRNDDEFAFVSGLCGYERVR